jgi:tetratricopeptide (TPR) repeat protein
VLRFENLSGDPALDWMGRAFSEVITSQLAGIERLYAIPAAALHSRDAVLGPRPVSAPGVSAERWQALSAGATRVAYGRFAVVNGRLQVDVSVEDPALGKMVRRASSSGAAAGGVLPVAGRVARELDGGARPFGTRSGEALRHYVQAVEAPDREAIPRELGAAVAADPGFGEAWVALVQALAGRQDRAGMERALEQARARAGSLAPLERARLEVAAATARGDLAARRRALEALVPLSPADPGPLRELGQLAMGMGLHRQAADALARAAALEPADPLLLNILGYARSYAGDLEGAAEALRRYERLRPREPNPLDSLGDIHLQAGKLAEAERFYLAAFQKNPNFISGGPAIKAAYARLMTGDVAGAETLFQRYLDARRAAKDPLAGFRRAEWLWFSGRRKQALAQMEAAAAQAGGAAWAQLAVWSLDLGDRPRARALAARMGKASPPAPPGLAALVEFVTLPEAAASEWAVRAERLFAAPEQARTKDLARAYALLYARQFAEAAPLLKEILARPALPADESLPVLLAWTLAETGRAQEAAPLLQRNPTPASSGLGGFASLHFPRLFYLRGLVAEKQGRADEARAGYEIFLKLSGDTPLMFGEEQRARR